MSTPTVSLEQVSLSFGSRPALRDVTLHIDAGEVVSFVGPNGSGKSTCLRVLIGLAFRNSGQVQVCGMDPHRQGATIRRRSCYLPGETSLYPMMTGKQLLAFAHSGYPRRDEQLAQRMLDRFDLPLDHRVHQYSAGMKQKLALLVALVPDVDVYLLDEPDRNLDGATQEYVHELTDHLRSRGKTVLLASHQLADIGQQADRLIFMADGRIIDDDRVRALAQTLRTEVRVKLADGTQLPPGVERIAAEPDGWLRVRAEQHPLRWLTQLNPEQVEGLEMGSAKLNQLYRRLTQKAQGDS